MSIITLEGITENGQIRLKSNVRLQDNIKVYVVVPGIEVEQVGHMHTPHLAHPEQAADFRMEIIEETPGANV